MLLRLIFDLSITFYNLFIKIFSISDRNRYDLWFNFVYLLKYLNQKSKRNLIQVNTHHKSMPKYAHDDNSFR